MKKNLLLLVLCLVFGIAQGQNPPNGCVELGPVAGQLDPVTAPYYCGNNNWVQTAVCDCPDGYVATGYEGDLAAIANFNVLSRFRLRCRALNEDGTLGAAVQVSCYNGEISGILIGPDGPVDAVANEAMVGAILNVGCLVDAVIGNSKPIADIIPGNPNTFSNQMELLGGSGGIPGAAPEQFVPDGHVIVGMVTYAGPALGGVAWRYAPIVSLSEQAPVINCPENCLVLNCEDEGWEYIIQAWLSSVTANTSDGVPLEVTNDYDPDSQGRCIMDGTSTVTWSATDPLVCTSTCTSMVVVADTEPPHFIEEAQDELDICNYNTPAEFDAWVAAHGHAQGYDGCWGSDLEWSTIPNEPSINCSGMMGSTSVSVTFVARDDCGNKASTTATFTALMTGGDIVEGGSFFAEASADKGEFELYQNQPNPFKEETVIGFKLPEALTVTLTIYDVSGKVLEAVQGDYSEGYNEVQINRSELSGTGLLYYQLETPERVMTKKMIVVE